MKRKEAHFTIDTPLLLKNDYDSPKHIPNRILILNNKPLYENGIELTFTTKDLVNMVESFNANVLGQKVPVNYAHYHVSGKSTPAAGWIESLEIEQIDGYSGLFATIDWTDRGRKSVFEREYRYHSIGAYFSLTDQKDGKTEYPWVLFELTLTNAPRNINLGEFLENSRKSATVENNEELNMKTAEELTKELENLRVEMTRLNSETNQRVVELTKSNESLKKELDASLEAQAKAEDELLMSKRTVELDALVVEKRISPKQRDEALSLEKEAYAGFLAFAKNAPKTAYSDDAQAEGNDTEGEPDTGTMSFEKAGEKLDEIAKKMMKDDDKMTYKDAMAKAMKKNPRLAEARNKRS